MTRSRIIVVCALLAFMAAVTALSLTSWKWHSQLETPAGVAASDVTVSCGATWGSPSAHTASPTSYIPEGKPCAQRADYSIMGGADLFVGAVGLVLVARLVRRQKAGVGEPPMPAV